MRKLVCLMLVVLLCMSSGVCLAGNTGIPNLATPAPEDSKEIPNMVTEDHDINGRPQKLDKRGDQEGDELTPVERRIIIQDAFISNAPALGN